jgi:DNA-binding NtrC family response regulator
MLSMIEKFAKLHAPVPIAGETGADKELAARSMHYGGLICGKPFVPMNCAAFPEGLIESELFGHLKGTFTDAWENHPCLVETAAGGDLFLDEIDRPVPKTLVALLRFLRDGRYLSRVSQWNQARLRATPSDQRSANHFDGVGKGRIDPQ